MKRINTMKKLSLILFAVFCAATSFAQSYGILVNGTTYFEAESKGKDQTGKFDEYLAHVQLANGDHFVLCNAVADATWTVKLDSFSVAGFTRDTVNGYYTSSNTGCYDFYIKLQYGNDQLYIGPGSNCGSGVPYKPKDPCPAAFGLLIDGVYMAGEHNTAQTAWTEYKIENVALTNGQTIQVYDTCTKAAWAITKYASTSYEFPIVDNAYVVDADGDYDFYIKFIYGNDEIYINRHGWTPEPTSAVPERCADVMFQCFYWDSYQDKGYGRTKWIDLNNGQAEEIGKWFDLVWLPPMSKSTGGTGYLPICYSDFDGAWGTKPNLMTLIQTLHQNGAKVVADIVINHVAGSSGWCKFAKMNFGEYGSFSPTAEWICKTDEMNFDDGAGDCKGTATGAKDDGYGSEANYDSGRDWDHTNADVRAMFKAYLTWLRKEIKIDGFRYDYCKGFHNSHINEYNSAAKAYFSVMEYWDGNPTVLQEHLSDANWNTLTFDFATKYTAFNNGIASNYYQGLKGPGLLGAGKSKYAVTFLDSHDSFQRDDNEFCGKNNSMKYPGKIQQCYAYMLSMPGVPCVFYPHWVTYKDVIKKMINARYKTGVHSESEVSDEAGSGYYKATITGTNGQIRVLIGPNSGYDSTPSGFTLAVKGENYGVYYKTNSSRGDKDKERTPQGIEETQEQPVERGVKYIENGRLYIRCGEQVYDAMGRRL